ncbi:MAG: putative baseplate assembly protein [Allosphingosinicella sp.]
MSDPFDLDALPPVDNPPGQTSIVYRIAPYGVLKEGMLREVSRDVRYLRDLNTRDPADPTIALIDGWAVAGDVLGFYAERIANEAFLKTATERRSIRSLARLIDYELRPGKAAEAWLAFTLESAPGAPSEVEIPVGVKVNSIPGPGETMVTFETVEAIVGRPDLNAMLPRMSRAQTLDDVEAAMGARCAGLLTDVRRGDWLILARGATQSLKRVEAVAALAPEGVTQIDFDEDPPRPIIPFIYPMIPLTLSFPPMFGQPLALPLFDEQVHGIVRDQTSFEADLSANRISLVAVASYLTIYQAPAITLPTLTDGLFRFKARTAVFGHNAVEPDHVPKMSAAFFGRQLKLDVELAELRPDGWIALVSPGMAPFIARVDSVETTTARLSKFSARVSRVGVSADLPAGWANIDASEVTVLVDSRPLALAPLPITEDVTGSSLPLDAFHAGLAVGRPVAIAGERSDLPGVIETELHDIAEILLEDGYTRLTLATAVTGPFRRDSVTINGNVALATHGETGGAPLGHGDASKANQRFRLPIVPLTHVGAANPSGVAPALAIWIGGILWSEVESLRDAGPLDAVYALAYSEDGSTWVQFGDGVNGRRLPTGTNNVVAIWRKGLGAAGMVRAGQLSLLSGAPQGVKGVVNPLPATGGSDGETLEDARANAPLSVMTLDRIVTLRDYEDFARSFAGIAKAHAIWAYVGMSRAVFLTVAGTDGAVIAESDLANLRTAIAAASDTATAVTISQYVPVSFKIEANIRVFPDRVAEDVIAAVEATLRDQFSFDRRLLGQPVARSEVIAAIQSVDGVDWVDLDALYRGDVVSNAELITAAVPRSAQRLTGSALPVPAELLTLYSGTPTLRILS